MPDQETNDFFILLTPRGNLAGKIILYSTIGNARKAKAKRKRVVIGQAKLSWKPLAKEA